MKHLLAATLCALVILSAVSFAGADVPQPGTLNGQFMVSSDKPMSDGLAYLYNLATGPAPSREKYWRVPDNVTKLDKEGRFTIRLSAGDYCIGAIKRQGTPQIGPPLDGDLFLLILDDKGKPRKYSVKNGENLDIGVISGARPFMPLSNAKGITAIEGTVQDSEGKPVADALVLAFLTPTIIGKPLFVSEKSGKDGKFLLRVHDGGTFYLKLRNSYGGGPPNTGAVLDGNKEEPMQQVFVKAGQITKDVVIKGKVFPGRGPTETDKPGQQ